MKYIPANSKNHGRKRSLGGIKYIVVHYTANEGDTAKGNANYFKNNVLKKPASAHYFVDDNEIVKSVPDNYIAYSVGGGKYKNAKGASFYKKCCNTNSISVELCNSVNSVPVETEKRAAEFIREKMKEYNIPIENVIRHYDVTGKLCPKPYVKDETAWKRFKERIEGIDMEELEKLRARVAELEEANKVYDKIDETMPKWIQQICVWALQNNIISGTGSGLGMTKAKAETLVMIKNSLGGIAK